MKIKLLVFLLCFLMIASVGCGDVPPAETAEETNEETALETESEASPETEANTETETETETEAETETESAPETEAETEAETETETEPVGPPALSDYSNGSSVGSVNIKTNSGVITGAENVSVPRPDESGRVLDASQYISPEKTGEQNASGFSNMLRRVKDSYDSPVPFTKINVPTGVYRIKPSARYAVHFNGLKNLAVEGNGSQFLFEDSDKAMSSAAFFGVENCDTIEFRNFSVDFDWDAYPLFVIGTVVSSSTSKKSVDFRIDSHKLPKVVKVDGGRTWDPALDNRSETVGFIQSGSITGSEVLNDHTVRVFYSSAKSAQNAAAGQQFQFRFKPNFYASCFRMYYNNNVTLNGVTIHSAPYEAIWCAVSDGYHLIDCKVVPPEGRRFTTYSGFETHAVRGNVIIEGCELSGILDDNIHMSNHFMGGDNAKVGDYTVEMRHLQTWSTKYYFYEGAKLGLYDENYQPVGWSSTIESVSSVLEGKNDMATYTVKFRDPLPATYRDTYKFFSEDFYNGSFIIRNNKFFGGLCHALYIGLGNGTIENNTMENFAYPSLILTTVTRWGRWHIGVGVEDVVIRNNVMSRCNTAQRDPASFAIAAGRDEQPTDFYPVNGYVIRNVLVENNDVDGSTGAAFAIISAEDVIVRNNWFTNSNTLPTTKFRRVGWGNAFVSDSRNITWSQNVIRNDGKAYEEGLYIDKATVKNFQQSN